MARKNTAATVTAAAAADTIMGTLGVTLSPDTVRVPVGEVLTYREASENDKAPLNVGRDGVQSDAKNASRAVSMLAAQFTPILCTTINGQTTVVDGDGRLQSARLIVRGFDFNGRTYDAAPDYELIVRMVERTDGSEMTMEQIVTLARYLNLNKNNDGVVGFISMARTALRLREGGKKGRALIAAMTECGMPTDEGAVSRGLAACKLPVNMTDAMQLNEVDPGSGIGYSVVQKHLVKQADGKIKIPTAAQFEAYKIKATYVVKSKVDGVEVAGSKIDYRGKCIDVWYACDFDCDAPAMANWKPNGTTVPVMPLTVAESKVKENRDEFKWTVLLAKVEARASKADAVTGYALKQIVGIIDRVAYVAPDATDARKAGKLTGSQAAESLCDLLESLANGTLEVPSKVPAAFTVPGVGDAGKSADDDNADADA